LKKEIKHNCPDNLIYSDKKGRCINPRLEDEENLNEAVPTKSLRFPKTKGRVQGVPQENKKTLPKGWN